jgi:regulator of replication initiation timing
MLYDIAESLRERRIQELRKSIEAISGDNDVLSVDQSELLVRCLGTTECIETNVDHQNVRENVQAVMKQEIPVDSLYCIIQPGFSRRTDLLEYFSDVKAKYPQYRFVSCCLEPHSSTLTDLLDSTSDQNTSA